MHENKDLFSCLSDGSKMRINLRVSGREDMSVGWGECHPWEGRKLETLGHHCNNQIYLVIYKQMFGFNIDKFTSKQIYIKK